jgi:hypothetical protein
MQYNRFRYRYCLKGYIESFNQFFRSNATNHPQIKGTGLGLSIVKNYVYYLLLMFKFRVRKALGAVTLSYHKEDLVLKTIHYLLYFEI